MKRFFRITLAFIIMLIAIYGANADSDIKVLVLNTSDFDTQILDVLTGITYTVVEPSDFENTNLLDFNVLYIGSTFQDGNVSVPSQDALDSLNLRKVDIAAFIERGGGVVALTEPAGIGRYTYLPMKLEIPDGHQSYNIVRITELEHPVMYNLTDNGLSDWADSFHNIFLDAGTFKVLAEGWLSYPFGWQPLTLAANYGYGKILVTGQDPDFHYVYGPVIKQQVEFLQNAINWVGQPFPIVELTAKPGTIGNTVTLEWPVPNINPECDYIVRYNTVPITESNWGISTDVDGEPVPGEAGTKQNMIVALPHPGGVYYFAIKTQCQWITSAISNSPYARSPLQLKRGWNLVSFVSLYNSVPIQSAISSMEDKCTSVWTYKNEQWLKYVKELSWLSDLEYMEPCRGYWMDVSEDCAWDFGNSVEMSPSLTAMDKPPFLLYGRLNVNDLLDNEISVSIRINGFEIDDYLLGSQPNYGDFYILEIPVDNSFNEKDTAQIFIDGLAIGDPIKPGSYGTLRRYDISYQLSSSELYQNYPNPCNPEAWIPYQLKENGDVAIQIYNIKGDLVRNLKLGYKNAGIYATKSKAAYWDGRDEAGERMASGIYFFTIRAGDFIDTKKMVVK